MELLLMSDSLALIVYMLLGAVIKGAMEIETVV